MMSAFQLSLKTSIDKKVQLQLSNIKKQQQLLDKARGQGQKSALMANLATAFTKPKAKVEAPVKLEAIERLFSGITNRISDMQSHQDRRMDMFENDINLKVLNIQDQIQYLIDTNEQQDYHDPNKNN